MKKNMFIYLPAIIAVLVIKVFYTTADSDALAWILAPTAWWVSILSGISFGYIAHVGYVSHEYRFIIASSCSGVRFLLLTFIMMVGSFTHLIEEQRKKNIWLVFCAGFSYISTVFVNGIRITVSIYLPLILINKDSGPEWLTAERLHTMIGTAIFFSLLFVIYYYAGKLCTRFFVRSGQRVSQKNAGRFLFPVFWYFVMVLGLPFMGRLYRNKWDGFWQYALLVTAVCAVVMLAAGLAGKFCRYCSVHPCFRRLHRL